MIDATPNEAAAMQQGGKIAGEYLDGIGKTDLAMLSNEEWATFVECVVTGYCDHLRDLAAADQKRIAAMTGGALF